MRSRSLVWMILSLGLLLGGWATLRAAEPGPVDPDFNKEYTETESGLRYRILREGDGDYPSAESTVTVNYKGWLNDGTVFDSSYDRDRAVSFPLNGVISGWTEGLQYVREGGMIELQIPADLGYGAASTESIPPNSSLFFLVELKDIR